MLNYSVTHTSQDKIDLLIKDIESVASVRFMDVALPVFDFLEKVQRRTLAGTDYLGNAFTPYNESRPYYFYPQRTRAFGAITRKQQHQGTSASQANKYKKDIESRGKFGLHSKKGRKFKSYGDFKRKQGASGVNLRMLRGVPSMMDHMVVTSEAASAVSISNNFYTNRGQIHFGSGLIGASRGSMSVSAGIYNGPLDLYTTPGDGTLAAAHNEGLGRMPKRTFMAMSAQDIQQITDGIVTSIQKRMR
jgi:hypothetical protein